MGISTNIQWCDSTVNPTSGCDGCELWTPGKGGPCYAGNLHTQRLSRSLPQLYAPDFNQVRMIPGRMAQAAAWSDLTGTPRRDKPWLNGMPRMIFMSDMSDMLSRDVTFEFLKAEVIDAVTSNSGRRHIWLWLTKRPSRLEAFALWLMERGIPWPQNVWSGTSVGNKSAEARIVHLLLAPVGVRFLSCEPMTEELDLTNRGHGWLNVTDTSDGRRTGIDWVICGGMSGKQHIPFALAWGRYLRDQCAAVHTPFFMKQLGASPYLSADEYAVADPAWMNTTMFIGKKGPNDFTIGLRDSHGGDWQEWPADLRVRQVPSLQGRAVA